MRNKWLEEQLSALENPENALVIQEAIRYIEQLEDDNESLQVALEGNIWSPKLWDQPPVSENKKKE